MGLSTVGVSVVVPVVVCVRTAAMGVAGLVER